MKENIDTSTEEKIKEAARLVFTQKGYSATKIRDIAAAADINLSLVNYYFRSKEKLFDLIIMETIKKLFAEVRSIVNDETTSLTEKLEKLTDHYIELLLDNPDFPLFIINEVFSGSDKSLEFLSNVEVVTDSVFQKQLIEYSKNTDSKINPIHILMNLMSLIIFPFLGKRILLRAGRLQEDQFNVLMRKRKELIPLWMNTLLNT